MVVVVILATIAYPSYQDNLRKGRRAAAQSFLIETASLQQQYLLDARSYAVVLLREIERTNESRDAGVTS